MSEDAAPAGTAAMLAVALHDLPALDAIFGPATLGRALEELQQGLSDIGSHLLARHDALQVLRWPGRWAMSFRPRADGLPRDAQETWQALAEAARTLTDALLLRIFGSGSAQRLRSAVQVLPLPVSLAQADAAGQADWLQDRLGRLPELAWQAPGASVTDAQLLTPLLNGRSLRTLLQPIVRLGTGELLGYEALTRGPAGSALERPDRLFGAARAAGRATELELLTARLALERTAGRLRSGRFLTLNLGPEALHLALGELPLAGRSDVKIELTEHMPLDQLDALRPAVERLRAQGHSLVLDDTGCGFADLETVRQLRPEIVKLCITVVRQAAPDSPVLQAIADTVQRLRELGSRVLAEGVETTGQRDVLSRWPIELAQGWLYAEASPVDEVLRAG